MSKIYQKFSGAKISRFLAPYDAAAFEAMARRYASGPRSSRFYAILSIVLAAVMLFGACGLLAAAVKSLYLEAYGVEVPGKILEMSFHTNRYGNHTKWKKLNYDFTIRSGDVVKSQLDRPIHELAGLPDGDRFTVLYWDRFPTINSPRGVKSNVGITTVLAGVLLLGSVSFACLARRMIRWRNSLVTASAHGHEGQAL